MSYHNLDLFNSYCVHGELFNTLAIYHVIFLVYNTLTYKQLVVFFVKLHVHLELIISI